jgi:endonuclease/exonuclease/phosphatase family metal-dependent hydrolase
LLPSFDEGEQRGVIEAEIAVPNLQTPLRLYATHLDYRADERERLASAAMINERIARFPDQPALLAGDLNATPDSQTLMQFATVWANVNAEPLPTIPVAQPTKQIDFILYRPSDRWKVLEVKVLDEAIASDHRAIFAVLELVPGKGN